MWADPCNCLHPGVLLIRRKHQSNRKFIPSKKIFARRRVEAIRSRCCPNTCGDRGLSECTRAQTGLFAPNWHFGLDARMDEERRAEALKGLTQAHLDHLWDDNANTIGALLLHLAATDAN